MTGIFVEMKRKYVEGQLNGEKYRRLKKVNEWTGRVKNLLASNCRKRRKEYVEGRPNEEIWRTEEAK